MPCGAVGRAGVAPGRCAELGQAQPELANAVTVERPALAAIASGRSALEEALDRERRALMRTNEERLQRYQRAAGRWAAMWTEVSREIDGWQLRRAHEHLVQRATAVLPTDVEADPA